MNKVTKVLLTILGILIIIGGFYCLFSPGITYLAIGYVIGIVMVVDAIGRFIEYANEKKTGTADGWMLAGAIISIMFGFFILSSAVMQIGLDIFIAYFAAFWILIEGIVTIIRSFRMRKLDKALGEKTGTNIVLPVIFGILLIIFGILCILNPLIIMATIGIFLGIAIIITGIQLIVIAFTTTAE